MSGKNQGCELDTSYFDHVHINLPAVKRRAETLATRRTVKKEYQVGWLFKAVQCLDLTTLSGDDTPGNVQRLCFKALHPIRSDLLEKVNVPKVNVKVAAVCVYPSRIKDCRDILCCEKSDKNTNTENLLHCTESETLENTNKKDKKDEDTCKIAIASVAAAFPSGQSFLEVKIAEIRHAVHAKAHEIDVVINRTHVLTGNWLEMYNEVRYMKQACEGKLMKTIIAVGELGSLTNVYKASMVAMMAGSDFIKTSTGKESVNATLPVGIVMVRAIRDYYLKTKIKVGFKAAGGIRSAKDACTWLSLINEELGNDWTKPHLFRIGASALLTDIERQIFHFVYGRYAALHEMPLA